MRICVSYFKSILVISMMTYILKNGKFGNMKILPKKGDLSKSNNWRGIIFLDVVSNLLNSINYSPSNCSRERRYIYSIWSFSKYWISWYFLFSSMYASNEWRTWYRLLGFVVDLVKAFDSIHHKLMLKLFKNGIPIRSLQVIKNTL